MTKLTRSILASSIGAAAIHAVASPMPAFAEQRPRMAVDLPAQSLGASIRALAVQSGTIVLADDQEVADKRAAALHGVYTLDQALAALLAGSGLVAERAGKSYVIRPNGAAGAGSATKEIVVTGTQIRGVRSASSLIVLNQQTLRDSGYADLGEVARSLPQSFGGGQNPALGLNVPQSIGANVSGASTVNLRGLGSDATLTILNGHRMPYDGAFQGVDISAIPLAAVERMEVVADGASAIYGSDAVGGVVNVILRQDYEGLSTRARIGTATQGGDFQQLYGAMTGTRWNGGGGFLAYEFNDNTEINSSDRRSTRERPNLTLVPQSRRQAVVAHLHQDVGEKLTFEFDGLYNHRRIALAYPINEESDLSVSRTEQFARSYSLALAGAAHLELGSWRLSATATYGQGRNRVRGDSYYGDSLAFSFANRYVNRTKTAELSAEGPILQMPGGAARLAAGLGLRNNDFVNFRGADDIGNIDLAQHSRYLFAEVNIPVVAPSMDLPLVHRLALSGALRHERYRDLEAVTTPKLGLIYAPSEMLDIRASWGKSFRAPSFYDQYGLQQALLYPVTRFGGQGFPPNATALYITGGNRSVKPERATSWSATMALHPPAIDGASLEVSYFQTRYVDRIVNPILLTAQALSNPAYAPLVTYSPSVSQLEAALADANVFTNLTPGAYQPGTVAAFIDGRNVNAGRQKIRGLDVQARYKTMLGTGTASFDLGATYLESKQWLSPAQPVEVLAGRLFNPPHWRARASATWATGGLRLIATGNFTGGVTDTRDDPSDHLRGMTTLDLGARYNWGNARGPLKGLDLGIYVTNVFDQMPATLATTLYYETPYDSTNYSAVGRFIAFEVSKSW